MTRSLRISPSQISRWRLCPRKTAWQLNTDHPGDVDTLPRANDLGSRCHEIAQDWLAAGSAPDPLETFRYWRTTRKPAPGAPTLPRQDGAVEEQITAYPGSIVLAGLHLLPAPGTPGLQVETELSFTAPSGATYAIRADLTAPGKGWDHKFVRDLDTALSETPGSTNGYKEPNYMGDNPQAILYAAALMIRDEAQEADTSWIYYQTVAKGGRFPTRRVHLRLARPQVAEAMASIEADAVRILQVADMRLDPRSLPAVPKACKAYGRTCEYVASCALTPQEEYLAIMTTSTTNERVDAILASLQNGSLGPTVLGGSPPPIPPRSGTGPTDSPGPRTPPPIPGRAGPPPIPSKAPPPIPSKAPPPIPSKAPPPIPSAPTLSKDLPPQPGDEHTLPGGVLMGEVFGRPAPDMIHGIPTATWRTLSPEDQTAIIAAQTKDPINPPEAPPNDGRTGPAAPAKRTDAVIVPEGGYEAMDRAALKALAVQRGVVLGSSRLGDVALRDLLRAADGAPVAGPAVVVPTSTVPKDAIEGGGEPPAATPLAPMRLALDAINAARAALLRAETALHGAMGL